MKQQLFSGIGHAAREKMLVTRGIQPTAMRMLVLDALLKTDFALSLSDLSDMLDRADKITLYRTLKTFAKQKLVHSIDNGTGSVRYALCSEDCECAPADIHAHFHCKKCDFTFCLPQYQPINGPMPKKFIVDSANVVLHGLCDRCS